MKKIHPVMYGYRQILDFLQWVNKILMNGNKKIYQLSSLDSRNDLIRIFLQNGFFHKKSSKKWQ